MARRIRSERSGLKIFLLIITILALVVGGLVWFDYLGILDVKTPAAPLLRLLRLETPEPASGVDTTDPYLLERDRIAKQWENLTNREEELIAWEESLDEQTRELEQLRASLEEKEQNLLEREISLNEQANLYEDKNRILRQNATYLNGMPPESAVAILLEMEDQDVIELLRTTEVLATEAGNASVVAYWLSLMPTERAADLQRKMSLRPEA